MIILGEFSDKAAVKLVLALALWYNCYKAKLTDWRRVH